MKSYPLWNDEGALVGFELSNAFLSAAGTAQFVSRVPGAVITHRRRWYSADEVLVRFDFAGARFVVREPYGENSRLWVGPQNGEPADPKTLRKLQLSFQSTPRWGVQS